MASNVKSTFFVGIKKHPQPLILALGLFGAALIYEDGAITPAILVLSTLEGLNIAPPAVPPYILPAAVVILIGLFALPPLGNAHISKVFGPIMLLWFIGMAGFFVIIDATFFLANLSKVADGGYVSLLLATMVFGTILIWQRGSNAILQNLDQQVTPVDAFMASLKSRNIPRVAGTTVFLSRTEGDTPSVMFGDVKHNGPCIKTCWSSTLSPSRYPGSIKQNA